MTIRHLNIFVAVADYGSMSAAATHLYLSPGDTGTGKTL